MTKILIHHIMLHLLLLYFFGFTIYDLDFFYYYCDLSYEITLLCVGSTISDGGAKRFLNLTSMCLAIKFANY